MVLSASAQIYNYNPKDTNYLPPPQQAGASIILAIPVQSVPEIQQGLSGGFTFNYFFGVKDPATSPQQWVDKRVKTFYGPSFGFLNTQGSGMTISNSQRHQIYTNFNSQAYYFGAAGRIEFFNSFVRPFVDVRVGLMFIDWNHKIELQDSALDNKSSLNLHSTAFMYGGGAGLLIGQRRLALEIKASYLSSQNISLIDVNTITITGPNTISYNTRTVGADLIVMSIGLSVRLN